MNRKKQTGIHILFFILLAFCKLAGAENLLINPGMEEGDGSYATGWAAEPYNNNPMIVKRETQNPYAGTYCVSIESPNLSDNRLTQVVKVIPNTTYKISGWIKTENIGTDTRGANLTITDYFHASADFRGTTTGWQYADFFIKTGNIITSFKLCLAIGGYSNINRGKAYFDEIAVEAVTEIPENVVVYSVGISGNSQPDQVQERPDNLTNALEIIAKKWGAPSLFMATIVTVVIVLLVLLLIILVCRKTQKPLFLKEHLLDKLPPLLPEKITFRTLLLSPYVKFFFICCIGFIFLVDLLNAFQEDFTWPSDNHYLYQAEAFLHGKIAVREYMHDMAVVDGKFYAIYPPFPLVIVFPLFLLFGFKTKLIIAAAILLLLSGFFFYRLLLKLEIKKEIIPWVIGATIFGTAFWFCFHRSYGVAFFAHICAAFTTILCLNEALGKGRGLLVGLFLGMAFLSRQLAVFMIFFAGIALWQRVNEEPLKKKVMNLFWMGAGLAVCIVIYLFYNYIRFGNIFDTGYSYLELGGFMQERVNRYGLFSAAYIPFNFTYLFLQGLHLEFDGLKISGQDWFGTALTFASPFVFFALWAKWKKSLKIGAWLSIAVIIFGQLLYYNNGWVQLNTQRFTLDFIPLLMILVALGMNEIPAKYWKPVILYSVIINAFCMWIQMPPEVKRFF